jgi:hypothetical protein
VDDIAEIAYRLFFVAPHEARITGNIRSQDGSETTLVNPEALRRLGHGVFPCDARLLARPTREHSGGAYLRHTLSAFEAPQWVTLPISAFQVLYLNEATPVSGGATFAPGRSR